MEWYPLPLPVASSTIGHVATLTRSPGLMAPLLQQQTCEEVRLVEEAIRSIPENGLER